MQVRAEPDGAVDYANALRLTTYFPQKVSAEETLINKGYAGAHGQNFQKLGNDLMSIDEGKFTGTNWHSHLTLFSKWSIHLAIVRLNVYSKP